MSHVLVIDDDSIITELIGSILAEGGHTCETAESLDAVADGARADCVISDLVGLGQYRAARAREYVGMLRSRFPGARLVVCTGHRDAGSEPDGLSADAVVTKPFDVDAILAAVSPS